MLYSNTETLFHPQLRYNPLKVGKEFHRIIGSKIQTTFLDHTFGMGSKFLLFRNLPKSSPFVTKQRAGSSYFSRLAKSRSNFFSLVFSFVLWLCATSTACYSNRFSENEKWRQQKGHDLLSCPQISPLLCQGIPGGNRRYRKT